MILATGQKKDYGRRLIPSLLWLLYTGKFLCRQKHEQTGKGQDKDVRNKFCLLRWW